MDIPVKYEDVVAKLDAALAREAALREENNLLRHDVASYLETTAKVCDLLGIDVDAAKNAEGKPSDVLFAHAQSLQQRLTDAEKRAEMLEREFTKLRDVAHGCYEIASSYSGSIDGVEEHGGDDHEDPSCAIHHRLYYAMFDADRALKPAAEGEGSRAITCMIRRQTKNRNNSSSGAPRISQSGTMTLRVSPGLSEAKTSGGSEILSGGNTITRSRIAGQSAQNLSGKMQKD